MDLLLRLVIWIIKELVDSSSSKPPQHGQRVVLTPEQALASNVRRIAERLSAVQSAARQQLESLDDFEEDLKAQVAPVLEGGVLERVQSLGRMGQRLLESIPRFGAQASYEKVQKFAYEIQRLETMLQVIKELLRQRANAADRALLGDADAVARACYAPILEFARHHQLPIATNTPMSLFYPSGTFIELAFIEQKLAPIGLPEAYRHEPWRWPVIAHEIAHDLYASLPAIEPELIGKLNLEIPPGSKLSVGTEAFDRFLFRVWLEEIFADAVGSLMIGPAYLRAMTTIFRSPDAPDRVVLIPTTQEGELDVHPPRHLRVHITGRFLHRQGFATEAQQLVRAWDVEHGPPEYALLATSGGRQPVPLDALLAMGDSVADGVYNAELKALAGHRLADVPGLDFSALHARRAEKARDALASGRPAAFDARTLIAAATEAALDHPDAVQQISAATRQSIVGVGTGERPATVRAMAHEAASRRPRGRSARTRRYVEALLLGDILERHPRRVVSGGRPRNLSS